ncbi:zinc finger BED domain-containing protein RICESLEEPER 2-like [Spodoptera litura]|uniref:Zinc finger BED domain-containing protein RICESLEEPER 2-like n=1 Tax=Spodoptera litura TaxID=69820 RepID=A0A9J7DWU6_SPOLT|nr:zinc finger BED domain-containing protein RICESLEEPER 2-like [Spodoptera litura]
MPRKKNTDVWDNYFHSTTSTIVKCKHCEKVYQFGNVSKMSSHLLKCYRCPTVIKNKLQKIPVTRTSATNSPLQDESHREMSQDTSLTDTTSITTSSEISSEITPEKKLYLDQLLSKAIFVTGSPLSIVEHPLWVRFFDDLQPVYKLPSRKAISTTHLETIYNEMVNEITDELKSLNDLHLQCDGWSNQRNEGIINFIIAKPEPVFVKSLYTTNNKITNRHTSQYISQEIIKVINVYGGHKFVTLIGDNAINIQRAFHIVKNTYAHIIPLKCVAHTLNLMCEDCLKLEPINAFISIATDTIKAIKKNTLLAQIVKEKNSDETLKLPGKTRWGSYCTALKSLKKSKVALQTLAVHEGATVSDELKSNLLDLHFWTMVENCINLLEPITEKIFKLEGNGILINEVYMAFKDIKSTFNFAFPNISILNERNKQDITNAVIKRANNCLKPIHYAAYLLDPRSQGIELDEEHEVDAMKFIHDVSKSLNIDVGVDLANYRAKQGLWSRPFIWKNVAEMDPVVWWRGLCKSKLLSRVAVRILTAPCTSAATERSFSMHAHIHSHKRNRLTTDRAAKIAFISYNWNLLHNHIDDDNDDNDEPLSTPRQLSNPVGSPINEEQPSTSRGNTQEIEFCNINNIEVFNNYDSSDSD